MASSEFLHLAGPSWQSRDQSNRRPEGHLGVLRRASVASMIWASLDLATAVVAGVCALRFRSVIFRGYPETVALLSVLHAAPRVLALYIAWFALLLIFFARSYGLYAPIIGRGGLHEQRMTVQAALTAGLLLCGAVLPPQPGNSASSAAAAEPLRKVRREIPFLFDMERPLIRLFLWSTDQV